MCSHAAVSDRYPHNALDRSVVDGIQAIGEIAARVRRFVIFRSVAALSASSWFALRFITSGKRRVARKTFTCAIYARGARRQRYSEERGGDGAAWAQADTWRLVSVACRMDDA